MSSDERANLKTSIAAVARKAHPLLSGEEVARLFGAAGSIALPRQAGRPAAMPAFLAMRAASATARGPSKQEDTL